MFSSIGTVRQGRLLTAVVGLGLFAHSVSPLPAAAQSVPSPRTYFGFTMGTDRKLARWDRILEYFGAVSAGSDRIRVDTLGPTTLGNPFVAVTLSSPGNLARLSEIRRASETLARGRVDGARARTLAEDLPATVFITHNIHSTEIGSSQTSVDLVYRLATATDVATREILDHVVTVLVPSANPDGQEMVVDWYDRVAGTEFERSRMPYLYHAYAGHDNNRDFFMGNLVETRYMFRLLFHDWAPQIYLDQHQMGATGARMFVPPYPDPQNPLIHPLEWQETRFLGGGIVADLQAAGKQGVLTDALYRIYGEEGALSVRYHNIVGLLTETASADLATPREVTREQLERSANPGRGLAEYGFSMSMVDPWWGGTWTLGDIVDYQTVAAFSVLRQAAKFRREYVLGRWRMARETMERARATGPFAYVIPMDQRDPVTAADLVRRMRMQGIEVGRADADFDAAPTVRDTVADGAGIRGARTPEDVPAAPRHFAAGDYVVRVAQPSRASVLDLLEPRLLPVRHLYPGGPFLRMYDASAYTPAMQMGVEAVRVDTPFDVSLTPVDEVRTPDYPSPRGARQAYVLNPAVNASYRALNGLLARGFAVERTLGTVEFGGRPVRGAFVIPAGQPGLDAALADEASGVPVLQDPGDLGPTQPISSARVGLYRGHVPSIDEGWTRLLLEEFDFPYTSLSAGDVRDPDLRARVDVVVIPAELPLRRLLEGPPEGSLPEEFAGGLGDEGVESLKAFVRAGGTLVTLERGDQVVLDRFDVPIRDALAGVDRGTFFLSTSLLNLDLDPESPLALGSPARVVAKWGGGRAYEPTGWGGESSGIHVVARWPARPSEVLASGQLVGAERLAGKGALLDVTYGRGHIFMFGFRVQHRMQTAGTFRLLLNALYGTAGPR